MYKLGQQNQMLQLPAQKGATGYKPSSSLVAWNNNNGTSNGISTNGSSIGVSYFPDHNVTVDPSTFGYASNYMQFGNTEKIRQEKHIDFVAPLQQQYLNQQYYHSAGKLS